MACTSLVSLQRACGAEGGMGGSEKLYMIAYNDLAVVTGTTVYTTSGSGVVNDIGLASGKTFVEIEGLPKTTGFNFEHVKNTATNSDYFNNTLPIVLGDLSAENSAFVDSIRNQPVVALIKTRTKKWFAIGLNGQFEESATTGGSGVGLDDLNGYNVTFSGADTLKPLQVDETIIAGLIGA